MKDTKLRDILDYEFLSSLDISNDYRKISYTKTKGNYKENRYDSNLWIYDNETCENYQITDDNKAQISAFNKDSNLVYKKESTDETDVFYVKDGTGLGHEYFSIDKDVEMIKHLHDDLFLLKAKDKISKDEKENDKENSYFKEIDKLPFYLNGLGFIKDRDSALYFYDASKDRLELIKDLKTEDNLSFVDINDDNSKILLLRGKYTDNSVMELKEDLLLLDTKSGEITLLIENEFSYYTVRFIEDKIIFVATDMKKGGVNEDCFIYSANFEGKYEKISPDDFDMAFGNSIGTDARFGSSRTFAVKDDRLYFVVTDYEKSKLLSISLDGEIREEIPEGVEDFVLGDDDIFYLAMGPDTLAELKRNSTGKTLIENKVPTEVHPIETFDFISNGDELTGYVLLPKDFDKNMKYPTLLSVHGGPKTEFSDIFHHEHQMFASAGYMVIYTNPHGSSGRGVKFSDIRGSYGDIDYDDLMTFTDLAIEKYPQIDTEKMGVYGGSYGGFMTNWTIGHTDRFAAACAQRSISNWTSFYGVSDIGYYFAPDQTASDMWDSLDKMWDQSPIKYAPYITTPTLFIHSDEDYRCPLEQGLQMYTRIKENGTDTKMYIFHGENHELSRSGKPKGRIKRLEAIKEWFDKYLKDESK
ncbi:S9 family peptidase [Anaerococcus sp.]|uniref:alpha/beta hydrolase family protein n=1 Tax=Anaerococcus sp. TaxID=1872515 RepID=UPI0027BAFDB8|nr:S9 family peptidase [Anaerococcus sp.]